MLNPPETLLLTVRHGVTEFNKSRRTSGRTDVPLAGEGVRQAEEARDAFKERVDVVIASPLKRAIQTACIVTRLRPEELKIDADCIERDFGRMDGLTREEIIKAFPEVKYVLIGSVHYSLNPPGGEPFEALRARAERFLDRVLREHGGQRVLVSSHQNFLQQLHGALLGLAAMECLKLDLLHLELHRFRLGDGRKLLEHTSTQLCSSAGRHASY